MPSVRSLSKSISRKLLRSKGSPKESSEDQTSSGLPQTQSDLSRHGSTASQCHDRLSEQGSFGSGSTGSRTWEMIEDDTGSRRRTWALDEDNAHNPDAVHTARSRGGSIKSYVSSLEQDEGTTSRRREWAQATAVSSISSKDDHLSSLQQDSITGSTIQHSSPSNTFQDPRNNTLSSTRTVDLEDDGNMASRRRDWIRASDTIENQHIGSSEAPQISSTVSDSQTQKAHQDMDNLPQSPLQSTSPTRTGRHSSGGKQTLTTPTAEQSATPNMRSPTTSKAFVLNEDDESLLSPGRKRRDWKLANVLQDNNKISSALLQKDRLTTPKSELVMIPSNSWLSIPGTTGDVEGVANKRTARDWVAIGSDDDRAIPVRFVCDAWADGEDEVLLVGSFNDWADMVKMQWNQSHLHIVDLMLPRGQYYYQFIVNGRTFLDSWKPVGIDATGRTCNYMSVY